MTKKEIYNYEENRRVKRLMTDEEIEIEVKKVVDIFHSNMKFIKDNINTINEADKNNEEVIKIVFENILNTVVKDESNEDAVEAYFYYLNEVKDRTYQESIKNEVKEILTNWVVTINDESLFELEHLV